jgi:hypothetical protein
MLPLARFGEGLDLTDSMSDESFERLGWCIDPPETNFAVGPEKRVLGGGRKCFLNGCAKSNGYHTGNKF